jgi:hypothetical protein
MIINVLKCDDIQIYTLCKNECKYIKEKREGSKFTNLSKLEFTAVRERALFVHTHQA